MIDTDLIQRYRAFRGRTGLVGRDAVTALLLARAEQRAEREGFHVVSEPEEESYESVYGEKPPAGVSFYWVAVYGPDAATEPRRGGFKGAPLAAVGFVDDVDPMWMRQTIANLYLEALDEWDAALDKAATAEARELASRATYAGPGEVQP